MSKEHIQPGKFVSLTYSITDDNGTVVEQSDLPVSFVYGSDTELIGGMDKEVVGKAIGDKVSFQVPPENGFGESDPDLIFVDDIDNVPPQFRQIGAEVQMQNDAGETKLFFVTDIADGKVTVDGNHPLAGKHLIIHVSIQDVRDALPGEEAASGIHASLGRAH